MTTPTLAERMATWDRDHPWAEGMPAEKPKPYHQSMSNDNHERVWRCSDCAAIYPAHHERCRHGRTYEAQVEREGAYFITRDETADVPYCSHCGAELQWDDDLFTHRDEATARSCWQRRFGSV